MRVKQEQIHFGTKNKLQTERRENTKIIKIKKINTMINLNLQV